MRREGDEGMGTLSMGAKNAVEVCMGVKPGEHVLIVTDKKTYPVGEALRLAAEKVTGFVQLHVLEDYGTRPMTGLPKEIEKTIPQAQVTFWAAQSMEGELHALRRPFMTIALQYARHGHLPSVTVRCMEEGMCSDYKKIVEFTQKLFVEVRHARTIEITNPRGTKLRAELNPKWNWLKRDGIYHMKGEWGNLPEGELFTAPASLNGRMVIDELGDWIGDKYGCLTKPENKSDTPVYIDVIDSRVDLKTLECADARLKQELIDYLTTDGNSNKAGELALPTNLELLTKPLTGNLLQDEKARVHIAFGNPYPELTGADWQSNTHIDGLIKESVVNVDGAKIMEADKYLV
jgi:aminopeptidase